MLESQKAWSDKKHISGHQTALKLNQQVQNEALSANISKCAACFAAFFSCNVSVISFVYAKTDVLKN